MTSSLLLGEISNETVGNWSLIFIVFEKGFHMNLRSDFF